MTKRGGRTTRGGRQRQEGRDGGIAHNSVNESSGSLQISKRQPSAITETNRFSNANPSQSATQETDTTGETEQPSGSGHLRAKRGITCGKGARKAMKAAKKRLTVEFNFEARRAVCANASAFMHECGYILRNNCSLQYKEWRCVPQDFRAPLRHKLLTLFDIDLKDPDVCKVIDSCMGSVFRGYRGELHCYFKEIGGQEDLNKAKTTRPPDLGSQEDWEYLCNMWSDPKYQETAQKRKMAREKRKMDSRNGSKSTIRYHVERGLDLDSSSGQIKTWHLTHWDAEKGWSSPDAVVKYEEMLKLRNENPMESMSDKAILEKVLGRNSVNLSGWVRDPVACKTKSTNVSNLLSYNQLLDEVRDLKGTVGTMQKLLIEKNILPPVSTSSGQSQDGASNQTGSMEFRNDSGDNNDEFGDGFDDEE